jgi:4'-phosphopantetheinyl transferase
VTHYVVILPVPPGAVNRFGRGQHRQLQDLARQAVRRSARRAGHPLERLDQEPGGRPLPWNGIHWSLSHKTRYVAGIAAPVPVGIDLERVRPMSEAMYCRVGRPEDWRRLGGMSPAAFFRLWTAKEAVLKAVGVGLRDLDRCRLAEAGAHRLVLIHGATRWQVEQLAFRHHLAAVAAVAACPVIWDLPAPAPPCQCPSPAAESQAPAGRRGP